MHKGYYQKAFKKDEKEKIDQYIDLATAFNKTHNLFVRKDKTEIYNKDILDCSPIIPLIKPNKTVADLGSGGGLPGILLSITKPKNKITLIESNQKKCYFLRSVVHTLDLKNTTVLNKKLTKQNKLGRFDIITARAFASIEKIIRLTTNNICEKSKYVLLKGREEKIQDELKLLDTKKYRYEIIKLDNKNQERSLVLIKNNE
jgi:16S rRNA (guanine527-N7)-methyltransferase